MVVDSVWMVQDRIHEQERWQRNYENDSIIYKQFFMISIFKRAFLVLALLLMPRLMCECSLSLTTQSQLLWRCASAELRSLCTFLIAVSKSILECNRKLHYETALADEI